MKAESWKIPFSGRMQNKMETDKLNVVDLNLNR